MRLITEEYANILHNIATKAFKIILPERYQPKMQSFNEFYEVGHNNSNYL